MNPIPESISAIIFDMDGILVDSEPIHEEALDRVFESFDIPVPPRSTYIDYKGRAGKEIFAEIAEEHGNRFTAEDFRLAKIKAYDQLASEKLKLFPGTLDFLAKSRQRFQKVALATSAMKPSQELVFSKYPLASYFDSVITADDITKHKPHPEPYLVSAKNIQTDSKQCMVIEDTTHGVRSAKAANCFTVGIPNTFDRPTLLEAGADLVCADFEELVKFL